MASITVTISGLSKQAADVGALRDTPREVTRNLDNLLFGIATGTMANGNPTIAVAYSANDAVAAWGTLTLSSGSGSVGGTIAGTLVTATWATSDAVSGPLVAAAINANTTVNKLVVATAVGAVVTVTALVPGVGGNQITLVQSGTGMTSGHLSSGKLSGGTGGETLGPSGAL